MLVNLICFNESDKEFKAVFIKAPHLNEKDYVYIDWELGQVFSK